MLEQESTILLEKALVALSVPLTETLPPAVVLNVVASRVPLKSAIQKGNE